MAKTVPIFKAVNLIQSNNVFTGNTITTAQDDEDAINNTGSSNTVSPNTINGTVY